MQRVFVCFVAFALTQVSAQFAEADYIENVRTPESRIVSGWEAYPGQLPWQVALRMVSALGSVSSCGGSVIHHSWAVTAAHCTALRLTIIVRAGVTELSTPEYMSETTTWHNYPTFDDTNPGLVQPNDISLLHLGTRITFSHLLRPIRVQPSAEAFKNFDQQVMIASGFGRTWTDGPLPDRLYWVYLRAVSNPACGALFGTLITDTSICARYYNVTSQSTCQGDSGGPLVHVDADGVPVLIGVASFVAGGEFGCHSGLPAGFCRVGPFLSWFRDVSGVDFENIEDDDDDHTARPPTEEPETTESPEEESDEDDSDTGEEDDSVEDPACDERCELLKKLDVKVKVHVRMKHRRRRFRSVA